MNQYMQVLNRYTRISKPAWAGFLGAGMAKRRMNAKATVATWQEQNPLRLWRLKQKPEGWKQSVMARQLKVSHTAVGSWESGKSLPMADACAKIEKLTGITSVQWMDWYEKKPK
jgi:ribosome-binding protein aMBF1 (putative translation factor)